MPCACSFDFVWAKREQESFMQHKSDLQDSWPQVKWVQPPEDVDPGLAGMQATLGDHWLHKEVCVLPHRAS